MLDAVVGALGYTRMRETQVLISENIQFNRRRLARIMQSTLSGNDVNGKLSLEVTQERPLRRERMCLSWAQSLEYT